MKSALVNTLIWLSHKSWQAHSRAERIAARLRRFQ